MSRVGRIAHGYTITTAVVRQDPDKGDLYEVVDVVEHETGGKRTIVRFRGTRNECLRAANKIGAYWKKQLGSKPTV